MSSDDLDVENREALQSYLQSQFSPREEFAIVEFEVLAGGVSSRTVRVKLSGGQEWVLKQALAKLRVEADWFSDPRRVHREALGMKVLGELTPPGSVPKLIFDDERHHVLGMEAVPRPHENWKTMLRQNRVVRDHFNQFGTLLADIHSGSLVERERFQGMFADRTFFESLRIEPYYLFSAQMAPAARDFLHRLVDETRSNSVTLVHGDFSPKNILVHQERLVLLDHEVIHWGDPAFDIGFALAHLMTKGWWNENIRYHLDDFLFAYQQEGGLSACPELCGPAYEQRCVNHALGCLLARVIGRSPLEYLNEEARRHQANAVLRLLPNTPQSLPELFEQFYAAMEKT